MRWLLLLLVGLGARAGPEVPGATSACPAGCACELANGESKYTCTGPDSGLVVTALPNNFARIICNYGKFTCTSVPSIELSQNGTLKSLHLSGCDLPESLSFACIARRLHASAVTLLKLDSPRGQLHAGHVRGLEDMEMLILWNAVNQTHIPFDVLTALPALKDFRLNGGKLQLAADAPPPAPRPSPPPAPHPALKFVELSQCGIGDVPPGSLRAFAGVTSLQLWRNQIKNLTADSFIGVESLQSLDLSGNPLEELGARAFAGIPHLRSLRLVATSLRTVSTGAFEGLTQLEDILIKFGRALSLSARALAALPALRVLTVQQALAPLPADLLHHSRALRNLTLSDASLESLPDGVFRDQQLLQALDLSGNKIKALDKAIFWPLKALQRLNLDGNLIEVLPEQLFSGLTKLVSVSADHNRIHTIAPDTFQGATQLTDLSLAYNRLSLRGAGGGGGDGGGAGAGAQYADVDGPSPLGALFRVRSLNLSHNLLRDVFSDWRYTMLYLRALDLRHNNYTELTAADVQFLSADVVVDFRQNHITTIGLTEGPAQGPTNDKRSVILLDENPYRCDCLLVSLTRRLAGFRPLAAEPRLDLGRATCAAPASLKGRRLATLSAVDLTCRLRDEDCPRNCSCDVRPAAAALELDCAVAPDEFPDPADYRLAETHLTLRRPPAVLDHLPPHVVLLNLSRAGLTVVPALPDSVRTVDLSHNELTAAPAELLAGNRSAYLAGNPLACDCAHAADVLRLQAGAARVPDAAAVTCAGAGAGAGPWAGDARRLCDVRRAALAGGALAALGALAAVAAAVAYKYSLEIKALLYSKGWGRGADSDSEADAECEWDAFVSFSPEDARWVAETLVARLEGAPHHLRLCVPYRDWAVGELIPAQIAASVQRSRRTVLVLTAALLRADWARLEFRAAQARAARDRRARLLLLLPGDVPAGLDPELRAYLATGNYLKWGDPWFWQKLVYALPHRRKPPPAPAPPAKAADKPARGGLDVRLTADGRIVNAAA